MLNSKTARLIVALLAAVLIWGYVVGEVNPSKTKTIRNIPITYTYEDTLNERGLAISGAEEEYLNLEVSGARAILGDISPNDISATINVASAQKGENEMSITIKVPSGVTINKQSITRTIVSVENLTQKPVNVSIVYTGDFEPNEQGSTVNMSSTQVIVSGAESLVEKVASARGAVDAANVSEKLSAIPCQLIAVDGDGAEVDGVQLSQKSISVTSILARQKTVELTVPTKENDTDKYIRETLAPATIKIFGNVDVIESIDELTALEIDLSKITETQKVELGFELPEGVIIAENEPPTLEVTVFPIEEKRFTFEGGEIAVNGASEELEYALPSNLVVTIKASDKQSVLDSLEKGDISLSIDVSSLKNTGIAEIKMECKKDVLGLTMDPKSIIVEVGLKSQESGSGNGNGN